MFYPLKYRFFFYVMHLLHIRKLKKSHVYIMMYYVNKCNKFIDETVFIEYGDTHREIHISHVVLHSIYYKEIAVVQEVK